MACLCGGLVTLLAGEGIGGDVEMTGDGCEHCGYRRPAPWRGIHGLIQRLRREFERDGFSFRSREGGDAIQRSLQLADALMYLVSYEMKDVLRYRQLILFRLGLKDGHPRLKVRWLDIGYQPPLEARAQALLKQVDRLRRSVAGEHDLAAAVVQVVKHVEEAFLRLLLASDELYIVDQEHVDAAVLLAEFLGLAFTDGLDEFVGELLGAYVKRLEFVFGDCLGDGVQEVGLT